MSAGDGSGGGTDHVTPNTAESLTFLKNTKPNGPWDLVAISPTGKVEAKTFVAEQLELMGRWIDARQGNANLYVHVNALRPGVTNVKARKADIAQALFVHVDIDDLEGRQRLSNFNPSPSGVVFSGGGYHGYWLLSSPCNDLELVERCNAGVAKRLGGDNCHNIDRVMRIAGTINVPSEKKAAAGRRSSLAKLEADLTDWSRRYTIDDFRAFEELGRTVLAQAPVLTPDLSASLEHLPPSVPDEVRALIERGDDPDRPRGQRNAHYRSRSEALYRVAIELVRAGCTDEFATGLLLNKSYGISESVLEKRNPIAYAARQIASARVAVSKGWPDTTTTGRPRKTLRNTRAAILKLGVHCSYDEFHRRKAIGGHVLQSYQGELSDDACAIIRHMTIERFGFDPGKANTLEAANILCLENAQHPIKDYLAGLQWDGVSRLDTWVITYLGAQDTELNRAISRIVLVAAVRRIHEPGTKFDNIVVLEGPQGSGKSTAIQILAGPENFSDQDILTLDPRAQMELVEGVWLYELGELEGLSRADTNKVKAFASRFVDRARPAYARFRENRPRETVFIGTTNDDKYLRDMTGNRRFWPVKTRRIDLEALKRDRDQLWAEAVVLERSGESIVLPEHLWPAASAEQEARVEDDPWWDRLANVTGKIVGGYERVSSNHLLSLELEIPLQQQQQFHSKRLAQIMRKLGWEGPKMVRLPHGSSARGYERKARRGG